jgi:hypothetical protein
VQASVRAVETRHVFPAGAASVVADRPTVSNGSPRLSLWAIELAGLALGVAFVCAVALDHGLANDEFWSMAAGQWMLAHHHLVGLDPFSYTESHRRWIADEWGSEIVLAEMGRAFGASAYTVYAVVLAALSLGASAAYARVLGARGGRVAAIVLLLSVGLAGVFVEDRGLDFSLVWFPLELLFLAKARSNPRWLFALPVLCVLWVNTHGSILLGLLVLAVELGWSLVPARLVQRIGRTNQSPHTGALALTLLASLAACSLTPYGPGLLLYDVGVSRNSQIAQYIVEWNSPNFHSTTVLLVYCVPLVVLIACVRLRRIPVLEGSLGVILFVEALRTQRLVVYLMLVAVGLAASLPMRPPWGATARRWAGAGMVAWALAILVVPAVPAGTVAPSQPVQAFNFLSGRPGRIFTEYTWGDYSIARHRATFADGRTDLFEGKVLTEFFAITAMTTNPDPILSSYHVSYVVWAPDTPFSAYLARNPRWRVVDRGPVALVFARR